MGGGNFGVIIPDYTKGTVEMDQSLQRQPVFVSNTPTAYVPTGAYPCYDNVLNQTAFRSTGSSMMTVSPTRESEVPRYSQRAYALNATFRASEQLMTTRTSSILAIDRDISDNLFVTEQQYYAMATEETASRRRVSRPGNPANGELDAPVGNAVFPMLVCAGIYYLWTASKRLLSRKRNKKNRNNTH